MAASPGKTNSSKNYKEYFYEEHQDRINSLSSRLTKRLLPLLVENEEDEQAKKKEFIYSMLGEIIEAFMKTELDVVAMDAATIDPKEATLEEEEDIVQKCVSEITASSTCASPSYQFIRAIVQQTSVQLQPEIKKYRYVPSSTNSIAKGEGGGEETAAAGGDATKTTALTSFSLFAMMDQQGYTFQKRFTASDLLETYNQNKDIEILMKSLESDNDVEDIDDLCQIQEEWKTLLTILQKEFFGLMLHEDAHKKKESFYDNREEHYPSKKKKHHSSSSNNTGAAIATRKKSIPSRIITIHRLLFRRCAQKKSCEYIPYQYDLLENLLQTSLRYMQHYCHYMSEEDDDNGETTLFIVDEEKEGIMCHILQTLHSFIMEFSGCIPDYFEREEELELFLQKIFILMRWMIQPPLLNRSTTTSGIEEEKQKKKKVFVLLPAHIFAMIDPYANWFMIYSRIVLDPAKLMNMMSATGFGKDLMYRCFHYGRLRSGFEVEVDDAQEEERKKMRHFKLKAFYKQRDIVQEAAGEHSKVENVWNIQDFDFSLYLSSLSMLRTILVSTAISQSDIKATFLYRKDDEKMLYLTSHELSSWIEAAVDGDNDERIISRCRKGTDVEITASSTSPSAYDSSVSEILRMINPFLKALDIGIIALPTNTTTSSVSLANDTNDTLVNKALAHTCSEALESVLVGCIATTASQTNTDDITINNDFENSWNTFSSIFSHIVQTIVSSKIAIYCQQGGVGSDKAAKGEREKQEGELLKLCLPSPSLMEFFSLCQRIIGKATTWWCEHNRSAASNQPSCTDVNEASLEKKSSTFISAVKMIIDAVESIMCSSLNKVNATSSLLAKKEVENNKDDLSDFCFALGSVLSTLQPILQSTALARFCHSKRQSILYSIQGYYDIASLLGYSSESLGIIMTTFVSSFEGLMVVDEIGLVSKCMMIATQHIFADEEENNDLDTNRHIIDRQYLHLQIQQMCTIKGGFLALASSLAMRRMHSCMMVSASAYASACNNDSALEVAEEKIEYCWVFSLLSSILSGYMVSLTFHESKRRGNINTILCNIAELVIKTKHQGLQGLLCRMLGAICSNLDFAIFIGGQFCSKISDLETVSPVSHNGAKLYPKYLANLLHGHLSSPPAGNDCMMLCSDTESYDSIQASVRSVVERIRKVTSGNDQLSTSAVCEALSFLSKPDVLESISLLSDLSLHEASMTKNGYFATELSVDEHFASSAVQFVKRCFQWHRLEMNEMAAASRYEKDMAQLICCQTANSHLSVDWFAVCIMALCKGNIAKTKLFLNILLTDQKHCVALLHQQADGGIDSHCTAIVRLSHEILEYECPEVIIALDEMGFSLSSALRLWIRQSFVGFLSFGDAILLNAILIALGADYYVYFIIAILRYLQPAIVKQASLHRETGRAAEAPFTVLNASTFRIADALGYADNLCRHHRGHCLKTIAEELKQF